MIYRLELNCNQECVIDGDSMLPVVDAEQNLPRVSKHQHMKILVAQISLLHSVSMYMMNYGKVRCIK